MPPKKKKNSQPKNAFFFFMLEHKRKLEAEGFVFPEGLKDVSDSAGFAWKGLDPKSKAHYENLAEREKVSGSRGVRYNTHGQTYEEVEREQREAERKKQQMLSTIKRDVTYNGRNGLKSRRFYFIHVNHYGTMEDHRFIPCEVAVLAYSINEGFDRRKIYHDLIKNMELPNGYTYKAKSQSEATHKCPLPPYAMGTSNHQKIYESILNLMDGNGDLEDGSPPPMYTLTQFIPEAVDFFAKGNDFLPSANHFLYVYPLEELFFQMKNFGLKPEGQRLLFNGVQDEGFFFLANAADILKGDIYDYSAGIACQFHEDEDVRQHCSRSYVIRWSYLFSDHLCANLDVPIVSERHTPRGTNFNTVVITTQMNQMKLASKPAPLPAPMPMPVRHIVDGPRESCGRGKPLDGTTRRERPHTPHHDQWASFPSTSQVERRASNDRIMNDQPLTIIDHSQFQVDDSDYVPPPPVAKTAYEDAPLRLPKSKGKSSLMENAMRAQQAQGGDGQNLLLGGVGRGRGLLKSP